MMFFQMPFASQNYLVSVFVTLFLFISWAVPPAVHAAEKKKSYKLETAQIKIGMFPRTPSQMAAFYEGRGFSKQAIEETTRYCFITVGMRNIGKQKIWLDLSTWQFHSKKGDIQRKTREQWKTTWQKLDVPLPSQATFNWTLLPEHRDLHPDEPAGGNITLRPTYESFVVEATFATGEDKKGKPLVIRMENVRCLKNGEEGS